MLIAMVNTFLIMLNVGKTVMIFVYIGAIFSATVGIWMIGYFLDKKNMQYFLDEAIFDRGKTRKKLEELKSNGTIKQNEVIK